MEDSPRGVPAAKPITPEIRDWLIAELIADRTDKTYRSAESAEELPQDYGSYAVYDGLRNMGGGCSRNLLSSYMDALARGYAVFIFLWKPDDDGEVRKWVDGDHDQDEEDEWECPRCGGTGLLSE